MTHTVVLTQTGATALDLAWAAGLFEGEGCISKQISGKAQAPRCAIGMSDEDVIRRFHSVVGVGSVHRIDRHKRKETHKDMWVWTAAGFPSAQYVVALLWNWFGTRRREKAEEILTWAKSLPARRRTECKRGHSLTDESNVYRHPQRNTRHCKQCMAINSRNHYLRQKGD